MTPQGWIIVGVVAQLLISCATLLKLAFFAGKITTQVENNTDEIEKLRKWRESLSNGITAKAHNAHGGL